MIKLPSADRGLILNRYRALFKEYGCSPQSLGWTKGKQNIRFDILSSYFELKRKKILDIGCGFGDLFKYLNILGVDTQYHGIDIVDVFIDKAKELFPEEEACCFDCEDFLSADFPDKYDVIFGSGCFNLKLEETDNYEYIGRAFEKAYDLCEEGFAFDFLKDRVNFMREHCFYYNPEKLLCLAYSYSRNVVLRSDYMPFEFSICVYKDDSFNSNTVFNKYWEKFDGIEM